MITFERRQKLIEILRKQPGLRVPELAGLLQVSQGTIRNDLNALNEEGQVRRVHGGASVTSETQAHSSSFTTRLRKNHAAKEAIACRAAERVEDGDSILLDASTTVYCMVPFLRKRNKLRVITNGIEAARALAHHPTNTVILLGGILNMDGSTISGTLSEQFLQDLHVRTAFVSCSGFTPEAGLTEVQIEEATLKIKMIRAADRTIALIDASKFGRVDLTAFAQAAQVSQFFTDDGIDPAWVTRLRQTGQEVAICARGPAS